MNPTTMHERRRRERGAFLAAVGIFMALGAFFAFVVVGIDLGRLAYTATEVQTVADVGATAGAKGLLDDAANWETQARTVTDENPVNGAPVPAAGVQLIAGNFDDDNACPDPKLPGFNKFCAGGAPENAVKADVTQQVTNLVAALPPIGAVNSTVNKVAVAAFGCINSARVDLPLAFGECFFQDDCVSQDCLPVLTQPAPSDNGGWTSLSPDPAGNSTIMGLLPAPCGTMPADSDGVPLSVGDPITINNTAGPNPFRAVLAMWCQNPDAEYVVPIIGCTQFNQTRPVEGFATIKIDHLARVTGGSEITLTQSACNGNLCTGAPPDKIYLKSLLRTDPGEGGGVSGEPCGFGTLKVVLIR